MQNIEKYLSLYSSHKLYKYSLNLTLEYDVAVVVPLKGESELFPQCLASMERARTFSSQSVLLIVVVNHREDDAAALKEMNRKHLEELLSYNGELTLLPVDCANEGFEFPAKQGVGLARKVGCDLALDLFHQGRIKYPHVLTTDGDAVVPEDYLSPITRKDAARIHHFRHTPSGDEKIDYATRLYESWLRYYVLGLRFAGSPYDFQTVGSLLSIDYSAYSMVRGFPRKEAGEDFYLLSKLAKVGSISSISRTVKLRSRTSNRVPFGTGRGVLEILSLENPSDYSFYHPNVFSILKDWLRALHLFSELRETKEAKTTLWHSICANTVDAKIEKFDTFWKLLSFEDLLETASRTRPKQASCAKHLHTEFDAFRTRKFIHTLRDLFIPNISPEAALRNASFTQGLTTLEGLQEIEERTKPNSLFAGVGESVHR